MKKKCAKQTNERTSWEMVCERVRAKKSILRAKKGDERTMRRKNREYNNNKRRQSRKHQHRPVQKMKRIRSMAIGKETAQRDEERNDEQNSVRSIVCCCWCTFEPGSKQANERALCVEEIYTSWLKYNMHVIMTVVSTRKTQAPSNWNIQPNYNRSM